MSEEQSDCCHKIIYQAMFKYYYVTFILLISIEGNSQCKFANNPNKWLYKPGLKKIKIDYPSSVNKATQLVELSPWIFGFEHIYSKICLAKNDSCHFFWIVAAVKYNKRFDVTQNDRMSLHFENGDSFSIKPSTNFDGEWSDRMTSVPSITLFCFYILSKEDLEYLSKNKLIKLSMQYTSRRATDEPKNDNQDNEVFNLNVSERVGKIMLNSSICFYNESNGKN